VERAAKEAWIRRAAHRSLEGRASILWSRHAVARLAMAALQRSTVEAALTDCEIIEDYPEAHRPLPDCLALAKLDDGKPVHAVVAIDEANERIFIVTVYRPDPARWIDERTRKPE
jgi:hypothetical protein